MTMKRSVVAILLMVGVLALPVGGHAQTEDEWVIDRFGSAIVIQPDGRVKVTETIAVDFKTTEKHGIYRDLPEVYAEQDGSNRYTTIDVQAVTIDGGEAQYDITENDANMRIRIGDPATTISGKHIYTIQYLATGVLSAFTGYDELYWNVTGNGWGVPILSSEASITLPQPGIIQMNCYVGSYGSTEHCEDATNTDAIASFTHNEPLDAYEGFTIAVGYRKGMVPILVVEGPKTALEIVTKSPIAGAFFVALLVLGSALLLRLWKRKGRDLPIKMADVTVVEYESPEKLRPAELGILMEESSKTLHVSATIVDLAVRGYLEITEVPKKGIFSSADYRLTKKKPADAALLSYEHALLVSLFESDDSILLSSLENTFYKDLERIKKMITDHALEKKFFTGNPTTARVKHGFLAVALGAVGVVATLNGFSPTYADLTRSILLGVGPACILLGITYLILAIDGMPQRTSYGHELYRQARGYKEFITHVETYRQQFFERENMFMEVLPYAIIFGATKKLATAMAVMGVVPPNPTWYHGTSAFNIATFSDSVGSFSDSLSSTLASAPSSSGSGSSGGFSGGGGGGGGGGSW